MKLRVHGNSLRFRLTQSEVASLAAGERVEASVRFAPGPSDVLTYAVQPSSQSPDIESRCSGQEICVTLPHNVIQVWAASKQVSIESLQPVGNDASLRVLVEKDFRCLHSGSGEPQTEIDAFPNPAEVGSR